MTISVITVCYNSCSTLEETMRSVLSQSWQDLDYIVVDGGSSDGSLELIQRYEALFAGRMRWISEPDEGIYDAMNKGIALAQGDIIGFLNSDDRYQSELVLQHIAETFEKSPEIDAVHGDLDYVNHAGDIIRYWRGTPYRPGAFQRGWMPAHPTFYCKATCFQLYGYFDTSIGSAADFELMLRFIEKQHITTLYIPLKCVYMRNGGSSTNGLRAVLRNMRQNRQAFSKNCIPCPLYYPVVRILKRLKTLTQPIKYISQK